MFVHTISFTSTKVVDIALTGSIMDNVATDRRGKHAPNHSLKEGDEEFILNHIRSYHPAIAHYRSEHAPLRQYLPSELTIVKMYRDYLAECDEEGAKSFSYSVYQKRVKSLNISFAKLGVEQCEECDEHVNHLKETSQMSIEKAGSDCNNEHPTYASSSSEKKQRKSLQKIPEKSKQKSDATNKHANCADESCVLCENYQKHRR